jgi:hypothetical protein
MRHRCGLAARDLVAATHPPGSLMGTFMVGSLFSSHPAVMGASAEALGTWAYCGSWSACYLTDGKIPQELVSSLGAQQTAAELVRAGLWRQGSDGYRMVPALPAAPGLPAIDLWKIERGDHRSKIPSHVREFVFARDRHRCVGCGSNDDLTLDHIHPWSKGGPDTTDNLQVLCRPCNSSKGARV